MTGTGLLGTTNVLGKWWGERTFLLDFPGFGEEGRGKGGAEGLQGLRAAVLSRKRRVWEECPASSPQQNPEAARSHESPRSHPETVSQTAAERPSFLPGPCMDSHPQQPEMATQGGDCGLSLA